MSKNGWSHRVVFILACLRWLALLPFWAVGTDAVAANVLSEGEDTLPPSVRLQLDRLAPQRPGVVDLYAVLVGADGSEAVFHREVVEVQRTLEERLDAHGRIVTLLNRAGIPAPQATLKSLSQTLAAVASVMDVNEDVLFLHIATHGSSDHVLTFKQPGYKLYGLDAKYLGKALVATRIRYRVLVISACYAGGFVVPFASGNTLTVAAASPARMSYGCGNDSEITDFSRAFYSQALRQESSVVRAARKAVQIIHENELASKREPSYPQVQAGPGIEERLRLLEEQVKVSRQPRLRDALGLPAK